MRHDPVNDAADDSPNPPAGRARRRSRAAALLAGAVVLAGVAGAGPVAADEPVLPDLDPAVTGDPFFSYARPAEHGVTVEEAVRVPLRDGGFVVCDVARPAAADGTPAPGRFPGVLHEYTAYGRGEAPEWLVTRGYVVLDCDPRGSGDSPGRLDPFSAQEQRDAADVVDWLGTREFSTGKVGLFGTSYGAHIGLLTATQQPEHLTTVVPVNGISDWYENTIYHGGVETPRINAWQASTAPDTLVTYRQHPLYDDYWRERSVKARWDRLTVPVLEVNGWYDRYRDGMVENLTARPGNVWMVSGPWEHARTDGLSTGAYLAWFDHWLKDLPGAPLPAARITSYEGPRPGAGTGWTQFASWPAPGVRTQQVRFTRDGALATAGGRPGTTTYPVNPSDGQNPDEAAADGTRATWTTAPLAQDLVLAGSVEVSLQAAFSASDGNVAVRLHDVAPDGTVTRVSAGWLKASHREGSTAPVPVEPGRTLDLDVHVWPTHYRFPAGHALRLAVTSGDFPDMAGDAPAGTVSVRTGAGGSTALLPVLDTAAG